MEHRYDYLIVGGGMTAHAAAKGIRERDADASIEIVGAERVPPYQRPPLTKALWSGKKQEADIHLGTAKSGAELHLDRRVEALDRGAKSVRDDHGDVYHYRRLLLATGATPRRLSFDGERVINYRTLDDYHALRRYAVADAHIAVVGGGFIGSEIAASLASNGCKVTMLFPEPSLGATRYPKGLSDFLNEYYRDKGVELRTGVTVSAGKSKKDGVEFTLSDGKTLHADAVVAGLGVTPNVELAEKAGLATDNGIVVDANLRTSDPDIWAAGDVANFSNPSLGRRLRVEHEDAALGMGGHAGRAMTGDGTPYDTLPFFYSDLFDLGYEAVGLLDTRLEIFEDWHRPNREGVIYYLDGGRVRGVLLWNVWDQVPVARKLIAQPGPIDAESLRGRIPG
ncbi:MAG: NAD(P)/FAD-dependent oxidoreductase [Gammaproteobacteria bacterium]